MKYLLLAITALIVTILPASAAELLIVQSRHLPVYDQAVRLLQNNCADTNETLVMSDYAEFDLGRIVREEQPRAVVAVGEQALKQARKLRRTPVVYLLALDVNENALGSNIAGISMHVAPEQYLKLFAKLHRQRVGVVYDRQKSGDYLQRARQAAAATDTDLISVAVRSPREVPAALLKLKDAAVDGLWLIPDSTAVTSEVVDSYFLTAQQQKLPVVSFSRGYLNKGALAAIEASVPAIVAQSCAKIRQLRSNAADTEMTTSDISQGRLYVNDQVADRLQLKLSESGHAGVHQNE